MERHEAEDKLKAILNQQEYQIYYQDNRSLIEKIFDQVASWFEDLVDKLFFSANPSNSIGSLIIIISILAIVVVGFTIVYKISRNVFRRKKFSNIQPLHKDQKHWTSEDHLQKANQFEEQQRYANATRHLFLSFLLLLNEKGLVKTQAWKTNWEYYDELVEIDSRLAKHFYSCAIFFEQSTYGNRSITKESYAAFRDEWENWMSLLKQTSDEWKVGENGHVATDNR
ncbi:DUF4129 domain-containing protein [Paraliobacillus sp. JSM ZJ581]|uniref:DUF4129 domain-containing protein n=1 Tax=Paraliobacillus sp. JSM ZJ581 TaxID=3342118 RepID=UPI0035A9341D